MAFKIVNGKLVQITSQSDFGTPEQKAAGQQITGTLGNITTSTAPKITSTPQKITLGSSAPTVAAPVVPTISAGSNTQQAIDAQAPQTGGGGLSILPQALPSAIQNIGQLANTFFSNLAQQSAPAPVVPFQEFQTLPSFLAQQSAQGPQLQIPQQALAVNPITAALAAAPNTFGLQGAPTPFQPPDVGDFNLFAGTGRTSVPFPSIASQTTGGRGGDPTSFGLNQTLSNAPGTLSPGNQAFEDMMIQLVTDDPVRFQERLSMVNQGYGGSQAQFTAALVNTIHQLTLGNIPDIASDRIWREMPWEEWGYSSYQELLLDLGYEDLGNGKWRLTEDATEDLGGGGGGGGGGGFGGFGGGGGGGAAPSGRGSFLGLTNWRI